MITVVDASVVIKRLLQDPAREADTEQATHLMERVTSGEQPSIQPVHWILEVGAVLARVSPETAADDVTLLAALELPTTDDRRLTMTLDRGGVLPTATGLKAPGANGEIDALAPVEARVDGR